MPSAGGDQRTGDLVTRLEPRSTKIARMCDPGPGARHRYSVQRSSSRPGCWGNGRAGTWLRIYPVMLVRTRDRSVVTKPAACRRNDRGALAIEVDSRSGLLRGALT